MNNGDRNEYADVSLLRPAHALDRMTAKPPVVKLPRLPGFRRADYTCALILLLSTTFILFRKPALRTSNPFFISDNELVSERTSGIKEYRFITYDELPALSKAKGYAITYTERSFVIDGIASLLLGGSIHYTRSTPHMWDQLLVKAKKDGLNFIQLYLFWNFHEKERGVFDFVERGNLTDFYERARSRGLFLHVRFGPYEWNSGGVPLWLSRMKGVKIRSSNPMWKSEMARIVRVFMEMTRPYLAENGGPVIMAQIENEYNGHDLDYVNWCGELIQSLSVNLPWVMCNGAAAMGTIRSCNSNDCRQFAEQQSILRPLEPLVWTEDEAWYQTWETKDSSDTENSNRSPVSVAYAVSRWFAVGGAMHNYYMYHGGNNYGRTASAGVTTMYADGANLHFDGLSNEPKRSHLRHLHKVLSQSNKDILKFRRQIHHAIPLGQNERGRYAQRAYVYGSWSFLENESKTDYAEVTYQSMQYYLPPQSVVILHFSEILYNTSALPKGFASSSFHRSFHPIVEFDTSDWKLWSEVTADNAKALRDKIVHPTPLEQLFVTQDTTDYLMYQTQVRLNEQEILLSSSNEPVFLEFTGCDANSFLVFSNNEFVGERHLAYPGNDCSSILQFPMGPARRFGSVIDLTIISVSLGLYSLGDQVRKGLTDKVRINNHSIRRSSPWTMTPGLLGEQLILTDPKWTDSVSWVPATNQSQWQAMTWYKTTFFLNDTNLGEDRSILLDCHGLSRGRAFINGRDIGRYWLICNSKSEHIQRFYHIPMDWLVFNGTNHLMLLEEIGAESLSLIRIVSSSIDYPDTNALYTSKMEID